MNIVFYIIGIFLAGSSSALYSQNPPLVEYKFDLLSSSTELQKKQPTDEDVIHTLQVLVELYKQNKSPSSTPTNTNSIIPAFLATTLQNQNAEYSSHFLFKMLRFLMLGSFFDKDLSRGLSDSIAGFAADSLGIDLDLGFFPKNFRATKDDDKHDSPHETLLKYAKYTVGLGIACVLTWLLVKGTEKFLENPQEFPRVSINAKIPFFSFGVIVGSDNQQNCYYPNVTTQSSASHQGDFDNTASEGSQEDGNFTAESPHHPPQTPHGYGGMVPQTPVFVNVGTPIPQNMHYSPFGARQITRHCALQPQKKPTES